MAIYYPTLREPLVYYPETCDKNDNTASVIAGGIMGESLDYTINYQEIPTSNYSKVEVEIIASATLTTPIMQLIDINTSQTVLTVNGTGLSKTTYSMDITPYYLNYNGKLKLVISGGTSSNRISVFEVKVKVTTIESLSKIYIGNTKVKDVKLGNTQINKVYLGNTLLFQK